jgi:hypothetical protein
MVNLRTWTTILILLLAALFTSGCSRNGPAELGADANPAAVPELSGDYAVNGINAVGSAYGGTLSIWPGDTPDSYRMQWIITGSIQEGSGYLDGNVLHAKWETLNSITGFATGGITYTVTVNGELYGVRSIEGVAGLGQETAYPNQK